MRWTVPVPMPSDLATFKIPNIESFNGRMRDELLNESLFIDPDYNTARPHSSLGYQPPAAYAGTLKGVTTSPGL